MPSERKKPNMVTQVQAKHTKTPRHSASRRLANATVVLLLALVLILIAERVRGRWRLAAVKRGMEKRPQVADITKRCPLHRAARAIYSRWPRIDPGEDVLPAPVEEGVSKREGSSKAVR